MNEINKNFDRVSWEWKGRRDIRELKPKCPECQYELDIKLPNFMVNYGPNLEFEGLSFNRRLSYSCPKCSFTCDTTIENVKSPQDLRKAVRKEFEHRQRLQASEKK
ncbi:MAG: hypothetical protein GWN67_25400 [Phycisphaerae bacterium]|nr:hypothetical protein [Phycisphaerae bacterium]NIP55467.1 hypothetical protein [Phycisphaerae bacterium]NIS54172.1 hypothetical protein [Phycisphaerae bacterium]NIU11776.1 hypothetical protein [Phycisphaerae bacterium]NIU59599.1 hypothetical protein [Phycisphaerae bacterium]